MRKRCLYAGRACLLWLAAMAAAPLTAAAAEGGAGGATAEAGAGAAAAEAKTETRAGAAAARKPSTPDGACIETEVNGYRALSYDCLNQKMAPAASAKPPAGLESEAITQRPPNQMGLPTPATIGNRMGNTFGTSAFPQRPQP